MGKKDYIFSTQMSMFGKREIVGFGSTEFCIKEIDRKLANDIIVKNHYSHKFYNATYIHLGVFIENEIVGVLQFGYAMNPASGGSVVKGTELDQYLELNRMWLDDKAPRNSESTAISYAIRFIRGKYKRVKWIQSFADERCGGFGIVYQAANFEYYGEHKSEFWEHEDGEIFHNSMITDSRMKGQPAYEKAMKAKADGKLTKHTLRQFRYLYWLDHSWKKNCQLTQKPYPKHYAGGAILNANTSTELNLKHETLTPQNDL